MLRLCSRTLVKVGKGKPSIPLRTLLWSRKVSQQLPRLPVPPLKLTCDLYLNILEPVVAPDELQRATRLIEEFQKPGGIGEKLQRGLQMKAETKDNWLTDDYVKYEYLANQKPAPIFVNSVSTIQHRKYMESYGQTRCAAELLSCLLDLRLLLKMNRLPGASLHGVPLCSLIHERLYSSSRIPGTSVDSLVFYSETMKDIRHVSVVHQGQFFQMDVYHPDGSALTLEELHLQLQRIQDSCRNSSWSEPVGILTSQQRHLWSRVYQDLMKDETNRSSLFSIQSSICTLCLDAAVPLLDEQQQRSHTCLQLMHGGGSSENSCNRWFDKTMQLIVSEDGVCGMTTSHAVVEGTVFLELVDLLSESMMREKPPVTPRPVEQLPEPKKLSFSVTPEIRRDIEEAKQHMDRLIRSLDLKERVFQHFGKNHLKSLKLSPDTFVQMAIQLAFFRMHRQHAPVLEPVTLRMFTHGFIGHVNATTRASVEFVLAFDDPKKQDSEKMELLEKAMREHKVNVNRGVGGHVVEQHLLGLRIQALEQNLQEPDIFTDPAFTKAFNYRVLTSQVTSRTGCLPCTCIDLPRVYVVSYFLLKDHMELLVAAYEDCESSRELQSADMISAMENAMMDMKNLWEKIQGARLGE